VTPHPVAAGEADHRPNAQTDHVPLNCAHGEEMRRPGVRDVVAASNGPSKGLTRAEAQPVTPHPVAAGDTDHRPNAQPDHVPLKRAHGEEMRRPDARDVVAASDGPDSGSARAEASPVTPHSVAAGGTDHRPHARPDNVPLNCAHGEELRRPGVRYVVAASDGPSVGLNRAEASRR
jgi:hypothetical protein